MNALKFLVIVFIAFGVYACSNNEDNPDVNSKKTKTVTLRLDGISSTVITKSVSSKSTASVINLKDVTVLLTDGTNIYGKKVFSNPSTDFSSIINPSTGYVFHMLDPAINKVIIVGNTAGVTIDYTNVATVKSSLIKAADEQDKDNVTLYGENILTASTEVSPPHTENTDYFTTTVNLSPIVSRIEIGKIQCSDLGAVYSSFKLSGIGLVDIYQQINLGLTNLSEKLSIYTGTGSLGKIYMPGLASPPVGGYEFGNAAAISWAYDAISPAASFTSSSSTYYAEGDNTKVFAYNFIPVAGTFPNIKMRLSDVTRADLSPTTFSYVSTKSFTGTGFDNTHPKPGYVYQFDLVFHEDNIGPFNPDAKICIDVKVTVSSWVIQALSPVFY